MLPSQRPIAIVWLIISAVVGGLLQSAGWPILSTLCFIFSGLCVYMLIKSFFPGF